MMNVISVYVSADKYDYHSKAQHAASRVNLTPDEVAQLEAKFKMYVDAGEYTYYMMVITAFNPETGQVLHQETRHKAAPLKKKTVLNEKAKNTAPKKPGVKFVGAPDILANFVQHPPIQDGF